jgi:subtilisin family serine protease
MRFVVVVVVMLFGLGAVPAVATPGPPGHGEWWFDAWQVQQLWSEGARGQGILIAEIDTGVNAGLPALSANVLRGKDFGGPGGDGRVDRDTEQFGHGTAMASLMVGHPGQDNILGMAPDAKVLPVAVPITGTTDDAGGEANGDLLQAIRWSADHGARIISMSLGAPRDAGDPARTCPAEEQDVIDYALAKGAIIVASGGNAGDRDSPIEEPSVCLGVISVGAVDSHWVVPKWSSRHPYLTVTAPGVNVPTIGRIAGEAFYGDGTSQAAAITSGGLAVIWSKYPKLSGSQVVARLLATLHGRRTTRSGVSGYGSIDIGAAVRANVPAGAPNPVYEAVAPFLARDKARAAVPELVAPPTPNRRTRLPGGYATTTPPGPLTSGPGLAGIIGAATGLAVVALLLIMSALRRRRTASQTAVPTPESASHTAESTAEPNDPTVESGESTVGVGRADACGG